MKPNFALNLSHEGISLLHRAQAGWLTVGDVSLDDPSLVDQLGVLRRTAADLETGGMTTKLVIPNSQILYTEVDAPGPMTADRIAQIRDGLVGLTPYDVRDLVFDWRRDGDRAQVAVVARETLQEAETFATQYRFNPVSFVAVPANGAFDGEPFFGPTRHAATLLTGGETIQPDTESIRIIGTGETGPPKAKAKAKTKRKPKPAPRPQADAKAAPTPGNGEAPEKAEAPPADAATATAEPDVNGSTAPAAQPTFSHRAPPSEAPPVSSDAPDNADAMVTFASRRTNGQAAAPKSNPAPDAKIAPLPDPAARGAPNPDLRAPPSMPPPRTTAAIPPPARTASADAAPGPAPLPEPTPARKPRSPAKAGAGLAGTLGKLRRKGSKVADRAPGPPPVAKVSMPEAGAAAAPAPRRDPANEAEAMTVFGARRQQPARGKPRYMGLVLTLILLLALAILALWSTYFMSDVTSGWFGTFEEQPEVALNDPVPELTTAPPPVRIAPTPVQTEGSPEASTSADPAPEPVQTPAPAAESAPEIASSPPEQPENQSPIDAAVVSALTDAATPDQESIAPETGIETARLEDPPADEVALPETAAPAPVIRRPLTRPEAEARYAATGIWQLDPDPLAIPGSDRIEGLVIASVDPRLGAASASTLAPALDLDTDLRPAVPTPPAALGTAFDFDERGLVRATPEGAPNPRGVQIFRGRPDFVPGPRPEGLAIPQDETSLDTEDVRGETSGQSSDPAPEQTPDESGSQEQIASLGGFSPGDLTAIRPPVRPASLWTGPETGDPPTDEQSATQDETGEPPASDASATTDPTTTAAAPPVRPRGFGNLVEQALREAARTPAPDAEAEAETQVAVAAPRTPSIPTRASVAKQATEENAINLSKVNLIGVYGTPSNRSALVRLKSGRFVKVAVGDKVDGGRVAAIGDSELRYVKGGRNITLKLPKG
ncbi:MAG: hypothetical protein QNJ44_14545 [Rhodobacter sp.]|nr:hypothetical protein [Rhodobacter sp.]